MEARLKVLDLFLGALGEDSSIASLNDRLRVQKAVYLGQLFGVDLGYRYSWYVKGPYCTTLTQDYFELDQQKSSDNEVWTLNDDVKEKLSKAKAFLSKPIEVGLEKPQWFELLASLHYLYKVSRLSADKVKAKIIEAKPHLADFTDAGEKRLNEFGLI